MGRIINRMIITGLLTAQLINFTACDNVDMGLIDSMLNGSGSDNTTQSMPDESELNESTQTPNNTKTELKGDVWEAVKTQNAVQLPDESWSTLPVKFLEDEGIITYDSNGKLHILNTEFSDSSYICSAFIDETTKENDVYVAFQCKNNGQLRLDDERREPLDYTATWLLKYTLDDDDYDTFLKITKNHARQAKVFVQMMDRIYQPEVVGKTVIADNGPLHLLSPVAGDDWVNFPDYFMINVDFENKKFVALIRTVDEKTYFDGYKVVECDFRDSAMWNDYGGYKNKMTEQEGFESAKFKTTNTQAGVCVTGTVFAGDSRLGWSTFDNFNQTKLEIINRSTQMVNFKEVEINGEQHLGLYY